MQFSLQQEKLLLQYVVMVPGEAVVQDNIKGSSFPFLSSLNQTLFGCFSITALELCK